MKIAYKLVINFIFAGLLIILPFIATVMSEEESSKKQTIPLLPLKQKKVVWNRIFNKSSTLKLSISNVGMKCEKNWFNEGKGYESCNIWFNVIIDPNSFIYDNESIYDAYMTAYINCNAELEYELKDGLIPFHAYESSYDRISLFYGHGTKYIEISWKPWFSMGEVVKVELKGVSCSISSVSP